jgi:hypothetical protein
MKSYNQDDATGFIRLKHLPQSCIKAVFMGLAMENKMKERLKGICQSSSIKVFEAVISNGKTQYEFREPCKK